MVHKTNIRVRYAETDKMGYLYYGNYATYFEVSRVEFLRSQHYSYRQLEDDGVMMPVVHMETKYIRPAKYDDLLTVATHIENFTSKRITFVQEVYNEQDKLLTVGKVELAFVSADTMRPIDCPENLATILSALIPDGK